MTFYGRAANVRAPRLLLPLLSKSDKKDFALNHGK